MKLYLAGIRRIYTANLHFGGNLWRRLTENEQYQRATVRNYLESYHYIHKEKTVERIRVDGKKIFLDSGAYSAFTQKVKIDLKAYVKYIQRNSDIVLHEDRGILASVLDGIGDPQKTWDNQLAMETLGVRPLPCYHYGEDEKWLEHYIARYPYITIGGMVPISKPQLKMWLDRIWEKYLCDGSGRPRLKVHGFGMTTVGLMERYPWWSVDSSSWVQVARVGGMTLLDGRVVNISKHSPNRKVPGQHLDTLPPPQRAEVIRQLESCGVDVLRSQDTYLGRWCYNMWSFGEIGERIARREKRFKMDQILIHP